MCVVIVYIWECDGFFIECVVGYVFDYWCIVFVVCGEGECCCGLCVWSICYGVGKGFFSGFVFC